MEFITTLITNITSGNLTTFQMIVLGFAGYLLISGKLTFSGILEMLKGLLKPGPQPSPGPTPTPSPLPVVNILQQLLDLLARSKVSGDDNTAKATALVMKQLCEECSCHKEAPKPF